MGQHCIWQYLVILSTTSLGLNFYVGISRSAKVSLNYVCYLSLLILRTCQDLNPESTIPIPAEIHPKSQDPDRDVAPQY